MISADCDSIRDELDAFADGELRGDELRRVAQHVEACRRCTDEVDARRTLGGLIRDAVSPWQQTPVPGGLASGVVARVRAESALSWRSALGRAVEDWHWVIVGGGAVTATFISTLFCSALLLFGTATPREDSLSVLGVNLSSSPGAMYAEVSPQGTVLRDDVMLVQLDTSAAPAGTMPAVFNRDSEERRLVDALAETLGNGGPLVELASMPEQERRRTEWLLDNIARMRRAGPAVGPLTALNVYRLHLVTNTEVTAKGLNP